MHLAMLADKDSYSHAFVLASNKELSNPNIGQRSHVSPATFSADCISSKIAIFFLACGSMLNMPQNTG